MIYFYCCEVAFHSDDLLVDDVSMRISGSVERYQNIKTVEEYMSFYENLKKKLFSETIKKEYPSASLSDCELNLLALNPL